MAGQRSGGRRSHVCVGVSGCVSGERGCVGVCVSVRVSVGFGGGGRPVR